MNRVRVGGRLTWAGRWRGLVSDSYRRRGGLMRRILWAILVLVVLVLGAVGWYWGARLTASRTAATPVTIPVAGYAPGTVRLDHGLWVARQPSGEFYVFLNRDPHRGEPLNWVESQGLFMQAASYQIDGTCYEGPCDNSPGMGLYLVESRLEGENLVVNPGKVLRGGMRPEPSWWSGLKSLFHRPQPAPPEQVRP